MAFTLPILSIGSVREEPTTERFAPVGENDEPFRFLSQLSSSGYNHVAVMKELSFDNDLTVQYHYKRYNHFCFIKELSFDNYLSVQHH